MRKLKNLPTVLLGAALLTLIGIGYLNYHTERVVNKKLSDISNTVDRTYNNTNNIPTVGDISRTVDDSLYSEFNDAGGISEQLQDIQEGLR